MKISTAILSIALMLIAVQVRPSIATPVYHPAIQNWALIVAGTKGLGDSCLVEEDYHSMQMYNCLIQRQYRPDHIYFISWNTSRPQVNNATSLESVEYAITVWLKQRSDSNDVIFIYFIDHGGYSGQGYVDPWMFDLGGMEVDVNAISDWLLTADLAQLTYGKLFFVIEACYCGHLITGNPPDCHLSDPNRILVCSTDNQNPSCNNITTHRALFSDPFIQHLSNKESVGKAFNAAYWEVRNQTTGQNPILDDNGDDVGHAPVPKGGDGILAFSVAWLPGEVVVDGKVDLKDVFAIQKAYGSHPGDANWDPRADLNGDYVVDLIDYYMATKNYGYPA